MFKWKFQYLFAIMVWLCLVALWAAHGSHVIELPDIVLGATVTIAMLPVQFFFRKSPPPEGQNG